LVIQLCCPRYSYNEVVPPRPTPITRKLGNTRNGAVIPEYLLSSKLYRIIL